MIDPRQPVVGNLSSSPSVDSVEESRKSTPFWREGERPPAEVADAMKSLIPALEGKVIIALCMSFLGNVLGGCGYIIQKLAHNRNAR